MDGSYSFLRHLGPFGCIKTTILSEIANLSKTWILENLDSTASTDHLEQKIRFFAIFQDTACGQHSWKIVNNRLHIAKFGCGSGAILVILFKKNPWSHKSNQDVKKSPSRCMGLSSHAQCTPNWPQRKGQ